MLIATAAVFLLGAVVWAAGGLRAHSGPAVAVRANEPPVAVEVPTATSTTVDPPPTTTTTPPPPAPPSSPVASTTTLPARTSSTASRPSASSPKPSSAATSTTTAGHACSSLLDGAQPQVAQVGNYLKGRFPVGAVLGRGARGGDSDHNAGLALDFLVDPPTGNALADFVLANRARLGVKYVIWRQRYNDGGGWSKTADHGDATANHYDRVHVSFHVGARVSVTC